MFTHKESVCFLICGTVDPEQDWKASRGLMAAITPKFLAEADLSDVPQPRRPTLRLRSMNDNGHLQIPEAERKRWLEDPVRSDLEALCIILHVFRSRTNLTQQNLSGSPPSKIQTGAPVSRTSTLSSRWFRIPRRLQPHVPTTMLRTWTWGRQGMRAQQQLLLLVKPLPQ